MNKQDKVATVMREFKRGDLKSSSGKKVTNPKQAVAIGLSEAGLSKKKEGGQVKNTSRMNRLEELGRVNAEKAYTSKGKKNLAAEKSRVVKEIKGMKKGGMAASKMGAVKTAKPKMGSASSRADGVAQRGKTVGKMLRKGGMCK
jgi:hypothetical protein